MSGVRRVNNEIQVESASHFRGAGDISGDIEQRLRWDARINDALVSVLVREGGRVTLSGTVGSLAEKRLAATLARVAGVREVDTSRLDVAAWARDEDTRLGAGSDVADAAIVDAITAALRLDPRIAAGAIDLSVTDGVVRLQGQVANLAASKAAEEVARNTRGTQLVRNLLQVEPVQFDDAEILRRMLSALTDAGVFTDDATVFTVEEGRAHIVGDVMSVEQWQQIDRIVANTRGVRSVANELTIRGESPRIALNPYTEMPRVLLSGDSLNDDLTGRGLHAAVESQLFWSPFVDEDEVQIAVEERTVTLTGTVDSMRESSAAEVNAMQAGALVVKNQLEVR